MNIATLLVAMHRSFQAGNVIHLGTTVLSYDGSTRVVILGHCVVKKTTQFTSVEVLTELYELLRRSRGVNGLIHPVKEIKSSSDSVTLYLTPVGFCGFRPSNVTEVKQAGRRILLALKCLHDHNFVHRDIRPANVMRASHECYLIDLEWANHADSQLGKFRPSHSWTPPEIHESECKWTCECDMWLFGKLLECWNCLYEDGIAYIGLQSKKILQNG